MLSEIINCNIVLEDFFYFLYKLRLFWGIFINLGIMVLKILIEYLKKSMYKLSCEFLDFIINFRLIFVIMFLI